MAGRPLESVAKLTATKGFGQGARYKVSCQREAHLGASLEGPQSRVENNWGGGLEDEQESNHLNENPLHNWTGNQV